MRLNGWLRIGIVLSVIWMIGANYYWIGESASDNMKFSNGLRASRSHCQIENSTRRYYNPNARQEECVTEEQITQAALTPLNFQFGLIYSIFYLVVAWLVIGVSYAAFRWIRKGFV